MMSMTDPGLGCGDDSTAATPHCPRSRIRHAAAFLCSVLIVQLLIQSCPLKELHFENVRLLDASDWVPSLRAGSNVSRNPMSRDYQTPVCDSAVCSILNITISGRRDQGNIWSMSFQQRGLEGCSQGKGKVQEHETEVGIKIYGLNCKNIWVFKLHFILHFMQTMRFYFFHVFQWTPETFLAAAA